MHSTVGAADGMPHGMPLQRIGIVPSSLCG